MENDTEYFRRRASEERTAALQARDTRARKAHLEMAERFEDLVRGIVGHSQFLGLGSAKAPQAALGNPRYRDDQADGAVGD